MFKVNKKTPERRQAFRTYFAPCSSISIVNFEHVIVGWEGSFYTGSKDKTNTKIL